VDSAITVSNDDLKKLYGDWKNRYKQQEETRGVKYFTIDIAPSEEDYLAEEQTIAEVRDSLKAATDIEQIRDVVSIIPGNKFLNAYISTKNLSAREKAFVDSASVGSVYGPYLENDVFRLIKYIGRVVTPDSVSFRQLAFPQSNEPRLLAFMDSIENLIKGGKDINELAVSMGTSAPLLSLTEIDLVRDLGESFSKEIFAAPLNQLSKIKSTNGVHLVYVTEKTQPVTKVKIAAVENPVFASSPTQNHLYNQASRFVIANADIKKFDSAARDSGYVVSPVVYLLPNNSTIGNVRRSREVVRWAFTNEPGSIKFFECEDKIVIAAIENKNKKGFRPIVAVENELRREIINSKKAEKIISELKSKPAKTLEEYAQTFQLQVDSARFVNFNTGYIADIGSSEPALEALAPIASENTLSEPVKGNKGVYLFSVYNKTQQNRTFDAKTEINNLKRASEYRIPSLFMQALRNSVNIEDNRRIFY
jgi:peptidyl-prolyl cis-trans isomerase D